MAAADVLIVSLGSTAGLRAADEALAGALRRAGAHVEIAAAQAPRELRTYALTDLAWARAARVAARSAIAAHAPRAIVYSTTTAALLWPRPGAIRFDAPAAANRPGRHGIWQRRLEARRGAAAPLLLPWHAASLAEWPAPHADALVIPIAVEPSPATGAPRDIAAITYAANPAKKGLDRVLAAWAQARSGDEQLVVAGAAPRLGDVPGVHVAGRLARAEYRALLRRARVFVTAPRREDYGIAQLEALADGCLLVTTAAPGPYAALPLARALDPRLVTDDAGLAAALRCALDAPVPDYAPRAATALAPFSPAAVDAVVRDELLPRLVG